MGGALLWTIKGLTHNASCDSGWNLLLWIISTVLYKKLDTDYKSKTFSHAYSGEWIASKYIAYSILLSVYLWRSAWYLKVFKQCFYEIFDESIIFTPFPNRFTPFSIMMSATCYLLSYRNIMKMLHFICSLLECSVIE